MFVRRVIRNQIHDDLHIPVVDLIHELVEVGKGAEDGMNSFVVGDVISKVRHWRRIDGRYPDTFDSKPLQVIEPTNDPLQVADAITIAVLKRTRVHLIYDPFFPPDSRAFILTVLHAANVIVVEAKRLCPFAVQPEHQLVCRNVWRTRGRALQLAHIFYGCYKND